MPTLSIGWRYFLGDYQRQAQMSQLKTGGVQAGTGCTYTHLLKALLTCCFETEVGSHCRGRDGANGFACSESYAIGFQDCFPAKSLLFAEKREATALHFNVCLIRSSRDCRARHSSCSHVLGCCRLY